MGSYKLAHLKDTAAELNRLNNQHANFQELEISMLQKFGLNSNSHVLEVGCGPGFVSRSLMQILPNGRLMSVDNDPEMLDQWQKNSQPSDSNPSASDSEFKCVDFSQPNIELNERFDICYLRFVAQHVFEKHLLFRNIEKHLKPGGKLIVVDSDDQFLFCHPHTQDLENLLLRAQTRQKGVGGNRHIGRELPELLLQAGLKNIEFQSLTFTNSQFSFTQLWQLAMGFKERLTGGQSPESCELFTSLLKSSESGELFFHTGIVLAIGVKT